MFWGAYPQAGSNACLSLRHWIRLKSMLELPLPHCRLLYPQSGGWSSLKHKCYPYTEVLRAGSAQGGLKSPGQVQWPACVPPPPPLPTFIVARPALCAPWDAWRSCEHPGAAGVSPCSCGTAKRQQGWRLDWLRWPNLSFLGCAPAPAQSFAAAVLALNPLC